MDIIQVTIVEEPLSLNRKWQTQIHMLDLVQEERILLLNQRPKLISGTIAMVVLRQLAEQLILAPRIPKRSVEQQEHTKIVVEQQ